MFFKLKLLSVHPSVCLSYVHLFFRVFISLSVNLFVRSSLNLSICMPICMPFHLYVSPYECVSICLSFHLSVFYVCMCVHMSICPSVHLSICPSVRLSVCSKLSLEKAFITNPNNHPSSLLGSCLNMVRVRVRPPGTYVGSFFAEFYLAISFKSAK